MSEIPAGACDLLRQNTIQLYHMGSKLVSNLLGLGPGDTRGPRHLISASDCLIRFRAFVSELESSGWAPDLPVKLPGKKKKI